MNHLKHPLLNGVRIIDLTWLLAGAGGPRFLAAMGAEVIRVEWIGKLDFLRMGPPSVPLEEGGKEEVTTIGAATPDMVKSLNRNGDFNDINPGKKGVSLNLSHPKGKELLKKLVAQADVVMESYSATAMDEMGVGFDVLREVNPELIYVQASGWGKEGPYANYLTYGPTAQAITGLTDQSGLPNREPAGWGFSYMDHSGAYYVGLATLLALYRKKRTGKGGYVDMAQAGSGLLLTGTAVLDYSANGRHYERTGNRSPYLPAAPHGAYRCAGEDKWIAIACFNETQWHGLLTATNSDDLADGRFATLAGRLARQDELDTALALWTRQMDPYVAMDVLQRHGVPAGVCQTAEDRVENDPQLSARNWLVKLPHSEIGTWPVQGLPFDYRRGTAAVGEPLDRAAPCYGEDNASVYRDLLSLDESALATLRDENVI